MSIHLPLKEQQITLSEDVHIHPIRVKMRGDAVVAMENFGAALTFFDPYKESPTGAQGHAVSRAAQLEHSADPPGLPEVGRD